MNTYMYAPKDSSKHRDNWRDLYNKDECGKLEIKFMYILNYVYF